MLATYMQVGIGVEKDQRKLRLMPSAIDDVTHPILPLADQDSQQAVPSFAIGVKRDAIDKSTV